jgi:hypothetical protein
MRHLRKHKDSIICLMLGFAFCGGIILLLAVAFTTPAPS